MTRAWPRATPRGDRWRLLGRFAAAALAWAVLPAAASARCTVSTAATLPLVHEAGHFTTLARIEGTEVPLLVDTGSSVTALDGVTAARLGLRRDSRHRSAVIGIGGAARPLDLLVVTHLNLGGLGFADLRLTLGDFNTGWPAASHIAGILGADLLSRYDIEIDGPGGHLLLHDVAGCSGRFLDWAQPYDALPLTPLPGAPLQQLPVSVDGHALLALVDTGASQSVLFGPALRRLGSDAAPAPGDRAGFGLGAIPGKRVETVLHRFGTLQVGRDVVDKPSLAMVRDGPLTLDMILGLDYLGGRRLWLSYATRQLFIASP